MLTIKELLGVLPQQGQVQWIGLRPAKGEPMAAVASASVVAGKGLQGDRYRSSGGKRQVTLIQAEHVQAIGSILNRPQLEPATLRRNIVVSGINLLALKDKEFTVGAVRMVYTGLCHPCSKMELALGPGGYNAMRGHGGINAKILCDGVVQIGDAVAFDLQS